MSSSTQPTHLEPSKLGTKEYWNSLYTTELSNHAANPSDIGTVWFDDSDAEAKVVEYLNEAEENGDMALSKGETSFLDLGSGNGSLLFALRDEDWTGRALGVDYSPQSVALARQVAQARQDDSDAVEFNEWDVIGGAFSDVLDGAQADGWDVVLDKGTFDAISLSDEKDAQGRRLCEGYRDRVLQLVKRGGIFLVTSCNWTDAELRGWFEGGHGRGFVVAGTVKYRSFSFGGAKGQTISTLCFRRV